MRHGPARSAPPALLLILAIAGCTGTPGAGGASPATPTPAATAPATPVPATPSPSPEPSAAATTAPVDSLEPPPAAVLVAGAERHPGEPGSWTWAQGSSDSPWLPAQALDRADVDAGTVTVDVGGRVEVGSWTAVAATADDAAGVEVEPLGEGSGDPSFRVSAGAWVVAVDVRFADGLGSAVYYWHLVVT